MTNPLDALRQRVESKLATEAKAKAAKDAVKKARTEHERLAANEEAMHLQAQIDWRAVALVFVKDHWQCQCGAEGDSPSGLMIFFEHTRMANCTRLAAPRHQSDPQLNELPRRVQINNRVTSMCPACSERYGFTKLLKETP